MKMFVTVFLVIFLAELGDKTQLATMLFATDREVSKLVIFLAASAALTATSAIGVMAGSLVSAYVGERILLYAAGAGFVAIGFWTLFRALTGSGT